MNLKEVFRYQNKLESVLKQISHYIVFSDAGFDIVNHHHISKADPCAEDREEIVIKKSKYSVDDAVTLGLLLSEEREKAAEAAFRAKADLDFCMDAMIVANISRQNVANDINSMLNRFREETSVQTGTGYKFNAEGNQAPYVYDIDVEKKEAFDRQALKKKAKELLIKSDECSEKIDAAMVNVPVDFTPMFDVNDSFEDMMESLIARKSQ